MDRWLGDGGMPIIALVGGAFTAYGVDGEDLGLGRRDLHPDRAGLQSRTASPRPACTPCCSTPRMNFAINAALPGKARTRGTLEMKTECMRPAHEGRHLRAAGRGRAHGQAGGLRRGVRARRRRHARQPGHGDLSPASTRARTRRPDPYRVPTPGPGVCRVCCGPGRSLRRLLRLPPVGAPPALPLAPVSPVRLCPLPGPLYTVLMGYKESPVPEARARFAPMVRGLFDAFFAATRPAWRRRAGGRWSCPSLRRRARPDSPLARVAGLGDLVRASVGGVLAGRPARSRSGDASGHMHPDRDGFVVPPSRRAAVRGRRLLLLDDTYVSGARAQSAAAALRLAGAASCASWSPGRVLRPDRVPRARRLPP